jgi:ribosomal protein S3AE
LPYIKPEKRTKYEKPVNELIATLKALSSEEVDGELNYIITKILKNIYPLKYHHLNKAIGVLECAKQEFYRRVASPYEDLKIKENTDV